MSDQQYQKIENHPHLLRDTQSGAIINTKGDLVKAAIERRQKARQQDDDITMLKSDMVEIKKMLATLINNSNNETS